MNARKLFVTLMVIMMALALVSVASAKAENPAPANQITLHDQAIHDGILMVDAVRAAQDGWIVIYDRANFNSDGIVGYAPVKQGLNQNVRVTLDTNRIKNLTTLWARLHVDRAPVGVFEPGYSNRPFNDLPVTQDGQAVVLPFGLRGDSAPLSITPAIAVKGQDLYHINPITVDSVATPVDGWLVIYKNRDLTSGSIVGYAPVYQGANSGVKVAIAPKALGEPTLWAVLQADKGAHGLFEWGTYGRTMADAPVDYQGQPLMVPFGTTGP